MVEKGSEAVTEVKQAQEDELLSYLQLMDVTLERYVGPLCVRTIQG